MALDDSGRTSSGSRLGVLIRDITSIIGAYRKQATPPKFTEQLLKIQESGLFDADWYLKRNPDVAKAKIDPLFHYVNYGGFEGRDPNSKFGTRSYLAAYPGLVATSTNPLYHHILHRTAIPVPEKRAKAPPRVPSSPAPSLPAAPKPQLMPPVPASLVPALPWRAIVSHGNDAGELSRVLGVARPQGPAARRFQPVRVDEDIQADRLWLAAGYLFDAPASETCFGWEGTLTSANNLANEALIRHLRVIRAAKLPTVLVYDAATLARPFYKDLHPLFSVHIDCRSLKDNEILPGPFASLGTEAT